MAGNVGLLQVVQLIWSRCIMFVFIAYNIFIYIKKNICMRRSCNAAPTIFHLVLIYKARTWIYEGFCDYKWHRTWYRKVANMPDATSENRQTWTDMRDKHEHWFLIIRGCSSFPVVLERKAFFFHMKTSPSSNQKMSMYVCLCVYNVSPLTYNWGKSTIPELHSKTGSRLTLTIRVLRTGEPLNRSLD